MEPDPPRPGSGPTSPATCSVRTAASTARSSSAGHATGPRGPRLLGRELIIAADGSGYVPGQAGYRALAPDFVRDAAVRARDEKLAYLAVHNHSGTSTVAFSSIDLASHERGYPALRQITSQIVGGLVVTPQAATGDLCVLSQ